MSMSDLSFDVAQADNIYDQLIDDLGVNSVAAVALADIAMPLCSTWRFNGPQIIEHWENAYDATA